MSLELIKLRCEQARSRHKNSGKHDYEEVMVPVWVIETALGAESGCVYHTIGKGDARFCETHQRMVLEHDFVTS